MKKTLLLWSVAWAWLAGAPAAAGDWPTWRHDARHSAACDESLPAQLHLQWTRKLPAAMLAWPNEPRLHFDACYEPVALGKTLVVGSPNDGSVTALDTETGAVQWKSFTDGPVRFAPVAWKGKVCAGSDDGYLYCFDVRDGRLLWKLRGAPDDRPDRRHLGNNRLISLWPVRGGPVLADGTIYFGAGIWPTLGVFVLAVDAESGKLLWRNGEVSFIEKVRVDHNEICPSGLSPQGYLAVEGDTLLVPNGRSMPAGLDRKTGKLLYYVQGYRNGDCRVTVMGKYAFVGRAGVVDAATGREVGSRWASAGKDAPKAFDGSKFHLFEGPIHEYKRFAGCSARSVLVPGVAYDLEGGVFSARDLSRAGVSEFDSQIMGRTVKPWQWDVPSAWTLSTELAKRKPGTSALIKAGDRLYGHTERTLMALDLPAKGANQPKVSWKQEVEGTPASLLAADGKLLVVTKEGRILCFGAAAKGQVAAASRTPAQLPGDPGPSAQTAAEILHHAKVSGGYCVMLGLGSGHLMDQLLKQSKLKIIAVDPDRKKVDSLREHFVGLGQYPTRVELFVGDPLRFGLPPYLASLIVSDDLKADFLETMPAARLFEVLRPYGGVACLAIPGERQAAFDPWVAAGKLENPQVQRAGRFALLRRAGPLPGSAPWTHETADAARSFFSRDARVKPPLGVLWYGDGSDHGFWKEHDYGTGVKPQVAGGWVFALQIHTNTLHAYDAYTGRLLWKNQVDPFTRYASLEDAIYVAGGGRLLVCDPATGQQRASFKLEGEEGRPVFVSDIRVDGDVAVVAVASEKVRVIEKGLWDSTMLLALDRKTGKPLWTRKAQERFNNNALAMGAGMVFCVDSLSPIETDKTKRRGQQAEMAPSTILALDARTGRTRWTQVTMSRYRTYPMESWLGIQGHDDWLAYCGQLDLLLAGKLQNAWAFEAATGKAVWEKPIGGSQPWILRGETFLHQGGTVFETRSGKPTGVQISTSRGGCNYVVGGEHLLFLRDRSASYIDLRTIQRQALYAVRSGCSNSLIAADGLLNVPCFAVGCVCNYPIQTSFALVHTPDLPGAPIACQMGKGPLD